MKSNTNSANSVMAILTIALATSIASADGVNYNKKITDPGGVASDSLGTEVTIWGDVLMIAAPDHDEVGSPGGEVQVYRRDRDGVGAWGLDATLHAIGSATGWDFGTAIAMDNSYAIIGAPGGDGAAAGSGVAFVHERNFFVSNLWGSAETLTAPAGVNGDSFGSAVGIAGDFCIVGAAGHSFGGEAYLYQRTGAQLWTFVKEMAPFMALASGDLFGSSIDMDADLAVIAANRDDVGAQADAGSVYLFERDLGGVNNWGFRTQIEAPDAFASDRFGFSVTLHGNLLAVGSAFDDDIAGNTGSVYLYGRDVGGPDNWGFIKKITAPDAMSGDIFGVSCSLRNDLLLVGANLSDNLTLSNTGGAYLFGRDIGGADNWGLLCEVLPGSLSTDDDFGFSVALGDNEAIIGARGDDDIASAAGAAHLFDNIFYANLNIQDCNNNGVADIIDISLYGAPDCNGNLIPDSCEINEDPGIDLDENGIPDECEVVEACVPGDLNGDGAVDTADLGILLGNFGFVCP